MSFFFIKPLEVAGKFSINYNVRMRWFLVFSLVSSYLCAEKTVYSFVKEPIDVVIPCAKKDLPTLELCIESIKKNVQDVRRVIVVSKERYTESAEWFDEIFYPFALYDLGYMIFGESDEGAQYFLANCNQKGWIYQQFLKLYAPFVIPGISSNVLIVDSDVIFYHPVVFINNCGGGCYSTGTDLHKPYFRHMQRLLPDLIRVYPNYSGISHHMLFQRDILEDLFTQIERRHHMSAWRAIAKCIDPKEINIPCLSEYEIYFNFAFSHTDQVTINQLMWANHKDISEKGRRSDFKQGYHYVAYHEYDRN